MQNFLPENNKTKIKLKWNGKISVNKSKAINNYNFHIRLLI